jgi:hypothetical protein
MQDLAAVGMLVGLFGLDGAAILLAAFFSSLPPSKVVLFDLGGAAILLAAFLSSLPPSKVSFQCP